MSIKLRNRSENLFFDDSQTNIADGSTLEVLQQVLEKVDRRQDKEELSHYRSENIIGEISTIDLTTTNGWYLFLSDGSPEDKNLVLVEDGTISDRYIPRKGDRIVLGEAETWFDGNIWQEIFDKNILNSTVTFFVNSETGDDSNDGLTSSSAIKTLEKIIEIYSQYTFGSNSKLVFNVTSSTLDYSTRNLFWTIPSGAGELQILGNNATLNFTGTETSARTLYFQYFSDVVLEIRNIFGSSLDRFNFEHCSHLELNSVRTESRIFMRNCDNCLFFNCQATDRWNIEDSYSIELRRPIFSFKSSLTSFVGVDRLKVTDTISVIEGGDPATPEPNKYLASFSNCSNLSLTCGLAMPIDETTQNYTKSIFRFSRCKGEYLPSSTFLADTGLPDIGAAFLTLDNGSLINFKSSLLGKDALQMKKVNILDSESLLVFEGTTTLANVPAAGNAIAPNQKQIGFSWQKILNTDLAGLPLIIRGKFDSDIRIDSLESQSITFAGADYYLYHVAFDNLEGSIFTRGAWNEGIYQPTINESFSPHLSLNFASHNAQVNSISYCVWQESSDLIDWNSISIVFERRGEGYFDGQPLIDLVAGRYYRVALLLSELPTAEDIILSDFSAIKFDRNDVGAINAIADAELLLAPIIGNQIRSNQNGDLVDISYAVTVQAASVQPQSLTLELMEVGNNTPINSQTYTAPVLGETITFTSSQIDTIDGVEPKQFYLQWSID